MGTFYGKALVIDNNGKFLEEIKKDEALILEFPCFLARSFKEATMILNQDKKQVRAVFISSAIGDTHGIEELKDLKQRLPLLPVFLISHRPELEPPEISAPELGFQKIIKHPTSFKALTDEMYNLFYDTEKWDDVKATEIEKFVELDHTAKFIPVSLRDFVMTPKSFFNLHIKLGAEKFIKILNAGEPIERTFLDGYIKKGVKDLFISADEQKKYLKLCDEFSKNLIHKLDADLASKAKSVLNLGANVFQNLAHTGITPEKLDYANSFLNQSLLLITNLRVGNTSLKSFIDSVEMREHSSSVSLFAGMIAREAGFESSKSVKLVGMASLVHDIGLFELAPDVIDEQELFGTTREDIFHNHAKHGAELLRATEQFDEGVCLAVEQHHMRRSGNDSQRRSNHLNLVAEIIGAADDLHNFLKAEIITQDRMNEFMKTQLKFFSPQIEKAVKKLLLKKPTQPS